MQTSETKDKPKPLCLACHQVLEIDHIGIKCPQDHNFCPACSQSNINVIFENPQANLPPKCSVCKVEIPSVIFERQLSPDLLTKYIASISVTQNEEPKWCPKCNYMEVWIKESSPGSSLFFCKNDPCKNATCIICNKSFKLPDYEEYDNREFNDLEEYQEIEEEYEKMIFDGFAYHQACAELQSLKIIIDKAIEEGEQRRCPQCGLSGRKDENCTHMICSVCQTTWCYFCGKKEVDCNKKYPGNNITDHNIHWTKNELRCPMYFTQIHELNWKWPRNDEDCLNYFHRRLTLKALKQAVEEIGIDNYYKIRDHFSSIRNNGYDIDEILAFKVKPLIKRKLANRLGGDINSSESEGED